MTPRPYLGTFAQFSPSDREGEPESQEPQLCPTCGGPCGGRCLRARKDKNATRSRDTDNRYGRGFGEYR